MIPVILSGGSGTRLWPLSRSLHPKQFIGVTDEQSLFQLTLQRLQGVIAEPLSPIVVCNEAHRFVVAEQCRARGVKPRSILLEPSGRNTAPAIAVAALTAMACGEDPLLLILSADHVIEDVAAFEAAIGAGVASAERGHLVVFGVVPTSPETGYGYIRVAEVLSGPQPVAVEAYVEKPERHVAEQFLTGGRHLWNSGMFLFRASALISELNEFSPAVVQAARSAVENARTDLDFTRLEAASFTSSPTISIDYAVMERTRKGMVVPLAAGWSDVGAWSSVWQVAKKDGSGNATRGDVVLADVRDSYVHAEDRLVTVLGLDDVVVVETSDAVLVTSKARVQDVKKLVDQLKAANRSETEHHRKVYRPWGTYDSIDAGRRYQVKRIVVKPGHKLSLQMHHHRAEHWVVVSGTAKVRIGEQDFVLTENQSTYIAVGQVHSLENPGVIPLELIEVQSGTYLGEDDIVRFDDRYGRA